MKIIDIVPKQIVVRTELTIEQINSLVFCLEHSTVDYNSDDKEEAKHVNYYTAIFYKSLLELQKRFTDGD